MIALTQEKREELANYARARLASHVVHGGCSDEEDIFKIALASLTAESVAWVFDDDLQDLKSGYIGNLAANNVEPDKVEPEVDIPINRLYTATPVPEIKFPDLLDIPDGLDLSSAMAALHWHRNEIKRLNGFGG